MWESPINIYHTISDMVTEEIDGNIIVEVKKQLGVDINKDELIKAINYDRNQYEKGYQDGLNADKWIPVTQPPKEKGKYLVTLSPAGLESQIDVLRYAPNLQEVDAYDFYEEHKAGWYSYDPEYGYCETTDVVAWMPLPKTFNAESEETDG